MLKIRSNEPEEIDDPAVSSVVLTQSLDFMAFVNRFLGGTRTVLGYFEKEKTPDAFTVLDIGSGGGDIPFALDRWARKHGKQVSITAIDLNPECQVYAQAHFYSPRIHFLRHSAFDIESLGRFDYITSSMFFHHLTDAEITNLLELIRRQSRLGFIVNDLYRGRLNYLGAVVLSAVTFNRSVMNDAALSVKRGFKEKDFIDYRSRSGVPFDIRRRPVFRITMSRHDARPD